MDCLISLSGGFLFIPAWNLEELTKFAENLIIKLKVQVRNSFDQGSRNRLLLLFMYNDLLREELMVNEKLIYSERVSAPRTTALFVGLMLLFGILCAWRAMRDGWGRLAAVFGILASFFLFYAVNYRTLAIRLTNQALTLTFGLFSWRVPLENIASCRLDDIPLLMRMGGAGIHFMLIDGRYRASFNFLEHPRIVIAFKEKAGPVQDISFSTRQPAALLSLIQEAAAAPAECAPVFRPAARACRGRPSRSASSPGSLSTR